MFETAVIIFREGLEAFLIVAIMLAYVTNTGRFHLRQPIFSGVIVALIISATTGFHVAELAEDPVWEGTLALIAGALVASFTLYIMKTAKTIRQDIHNRLDQQDEQGGTLAIIGVFIFTILMVSREGMETALMLGAISAQNNAASLFSGAAIGAALVALIAYLWTSQSHKINLKLFLQVTGVFLVLFSIELFVYGIHELSEMAALPLIGDGANMWVHTVSEPIEHPLVSNLITLGLFIVPCAWLGLSYARDKFAPKPMQAAE